MATQKPGFRRMGSAAVAAGLSFAGTVVLLATQQHRRHEELRRRLEHLEHPDRLERQERAGRSQRDTNLAAQQRLHWELLSKAMDDPDLAAVLNTYENVSPAQARQFLFANALYTNAFLAYRLRIVTREELFGHLRGIFQNPIVREYWERTRHHRVSLEDSSDEARIGRMVDSLVHDLEEAEGDEWWVVGEPSPHERQEE